jgi:hypothetical protein
LDDISRVLLVRDLSGLSFTLRINSQKFNHCHVGAVVRLRSVQLKKEESPGHYTLESGSHTNVLLFQPYMRQYLEITEAVIDDTLLEELVNQSVNQTMILTRPRIVTTLQSQLSKDRQ